MEFDCRNIIINRIYALVAIGVDTSDRLLQTDFQLQTRKRLRLLNINQVNLTHPKNLCYLKCNKNHQELYKVHRLIKKSCSGAFHFKLEKNYFPLINKDFLNIRTPFPSTLNYFFVNKNFSLVSKALTALSKP